MCSSFRYDARSMWEGLTSRTIYELVLRFLLILCQSVFVKINLTTMCFFFCYCRYNWCVIVSKWHIVSMFIFCFFFLLQMFYGSPYKSILFKSIHCVCNHMFLSTYTCIASYQVLRFQHSWYWRYHICYKHNESRKQPAFDSCKLYSRCLMISFFFIISGVQIIFLAFLHFVPLGTR